MATAMCCRRAAAGTRCWGPRCRLSPRPLALGCLGTRQPHLSLPMPKHAGSVEGALCRPESHVSTDGSPNAHSFVTGRGGDKAGSELGAFPEGRMQPALSPPASPGPLAGAAAPMSHPVLWSPRPAPPPSVLPCSSTLPCPRRQPQELSPAVLSPAGGEERSPWAAAPVCPLLPGAPGRASTTVTSMGLNISQARNGRALP